MTKNSKTSNGAGSESATHDPRDEVAVEARMIDFVETGRAMSLRSARTILGKLRDAAPGRPGAAPPRYELPAAAFSGAQTRPYPSSNDLIRLGDIEIDGARCWFEYREEPFGVFLRGDVPQGVLAFEAGGARWFLDAIEPGLCAVQGAELWHVDGFDGRGRWTK